MSFNSFPGGDVSTGSSGSGAGTDSAPIYNSLAGPDLNVTELIDPERIEFYAKSLANEINTQRMKSSPQKQVVDLHNFIADIVIETTAQGASMLEVHVIDPAWTMFMRDGNGTAFIDADEDGFLWPPIEVNFPSDVSDAVWRLCQVRPSTALDQPNVILVFEDKIASQLREHYKTLKSHSNETRAEFIQRIIKTANQNPALPGDVDITFVHLLPHSTFTNADLGMAQNVPQSAKQSNPPPGRKNHKKFPSGPTGGHGSGFIPTLSNAIVLSIQDTAAAFTGVLAHPFTPVSPLPPLPGQLSENASSGPTTGPLATS